MNELTRDLKQYRDVETFEEYEFTSCIAYEMAIRNDKVIEIIKHKDKMELFFFELTDYCFNHWNVPYLDYHFFDNSIEHITEIEKDINHLFPYGAGHYESTEKHEGFFINAIENTPANTENFDTFSMPSIESNFKRPTLKAPVGSDKAADVVINWALPKNELIAFIGKIKDEYDADHKIIITPIERSGEVLEKSGHKRKNGITSSDIADALFIYDYWKMYDAVKSDLEIIAGIIIELNEYHRNNGSTWRKYKGKDAADYLSDSTIRSYRKMMIYYIDHLHYKELLTGISA